MTTQILKFKIPKDDPDDNEWEDGDYHNITILVEDDDYSDEEEYERLCEFERTNI